MGGTRVTRGETPPRPPMALRAPYEAAAVGSALFEFFFTAVVSASSAAAASALEATSAARSHALSSLATLGALALAAAVAPAAVALGWLAWLASVFAPPRVHRVGSAAEFGGDDGPQNQSRTAVLFQTIVVGAPARYLGSLGRGGKGGFGGGRGRVKRTGGAGQNGSSSNGNGGANGTSPSLLRSTPPRVGS